MTRALTNEGTSPQLAIAIVHYHAEDLLRSCIESLKNSSVDSFAAVVVDNGSSLDLSWVEEDSRFVLLQPDSNLGFAAGTNLALHHLPPSAPLVLSLNPDVVLGSDTLEKMIAVLENPSVAAVTCRLNLPSGEIDPACRRSEPTLWSALCKQVGLWRIAPHSERWNSYNLGHLDADRAHRIDAGTGAFLLMRRKALRKIGDRLDERFFLYGEDLDLCRRLRESGYSLLYSPAAVAVHHKGSGRLRSARVTFHFYRAMWLYWRKWSPSRNNPLLVLSLLLGLVGLGVAELTRNEVQRLLQRARRSATISG